MNRIFCTEATIVECAVAIFQIMQLTRAEFTNDYPFLRLVSENRVWEFGIGKLTITGGIRIVAGKIGSRCFEVNYCAGNDRGMALGILAQVLTIMQGMPEFISYSNFRKAFPIQKNKPMINDPECWEALVEAANRKPEHSLRVKQEIYRPLAKVPFALL